MEEDMICPNNNQPRRRSSRDQRANTLTTNLPPGAGSRRVMDDAHHATRRGGGGRPHDRVLLDHSAKAMRQLECGNSAGGAQLAVNPNNFYFKILPLV